MTRKPGERFNINEIIKEVGQREGIPHSWLREWVEPFIYLLYKDEEIVYIGQSKNGITRLIHHVTERKKQFSHFKIINCQPDELNEIETDLIFHFKPYYNDGVSKSDKWKTRFILNQKTRLIINEKFSFPTLKGSTFDLCKKILKANEWIDFVDMNGYKYYSTKQYFYALNTILKSRNLKNLIINPGGEG